jgi:hypothetical protein
MTPRDGAPRRTPFGTTHGLASQYAAHRRRRNSRIGPRHSTLKWRWCGPEAPRGGREGRGIESGDAAEGAATQEIPDDRPLPSCSSCRPASRAPAPLTVVLGHAANPPAPQQSYGFGLWWIGCRGTLDPARQLRSARTRACPSHPWVGFLAFVVPRHLADDRTRRSATDADRAQRRSDRVAAILDTHRRSNSRHPSTSPPSP